MLRLGQQHSGSPGIHRSLLSIPCQKGKLGISADVFPDSLSIGSIPERVRGPRAMLRLPVDEGKVGPETPVARKNQLKAIAASVRAAHADVEANSFDFKRYLLEATTESLC